MRQIRRDEENTQLRWKGSATDDQLIDSGQRSAK